MRDSRETAWVAATAGEAWGGYANVTHGTWKEIEHRYCSSHQATVAQVPGRGCCGAEPPELLSRVLRFPVHSFLLPLVAVFDCRQGSEDFAGTVQYLRVAQTIMAASRFLMSDSSIERWRFVCASSPAIVSSCSSSSTLTGPSRYHSRW